MRIALGADHAGYAYKERIKTWLVGQGYPVDDHGAHSREASDYPDFVRPVAFAVATSVCERGIVLGGSGNGEARS